MPIQVQSPVGYKLQPQVFQPISPSSYFHHELPVAPIPLVDKAAKAQTFGAMMKVLGELPGHLTDEYQKGRQRGLQSTLIDRYRTALNTGNTQDLAGFQVLPNGTISYDPAKAVEIDKNKTEAALNKAKLSRMTDPLGGLPPVTGTPTNPPAPARTSSPAPPTRRVNNAPVEPPLPTGPAGGAKTPPTQTLQPLDLPLPTDVPPAPPALRPGAPPLRPTSDATPTPGGDQQLAAFVAPAEVADTNAGPVTTQTGPPLMAFHPGGADASTTPPDASAAAPAPAPAPVAAPDASSPTLATATPDASQVPPDQQQAIAGAAGSISNQLADVDPQFLSASNADNVPAAPVNPVLAANSSPAAAGAEPEVRRAIPVNQPAGASPAATPAAPAPNANLNGAFNNGNGTAGFYVNGVMVKIGIPDNISGDIKWMDAPKKGDGFDTPEDAFAYAKTHNIVAQSVTQGQGGKWYLGPSASDEMAGYKRGTPGYILIQHGIDPKKLTPEQQTKALNSINDPIQPETRKELARLRVGDVDPKTGLKLSESDAQALLQSKLEETGTLTDDQLRHIMQLREKYAGLPIYRNAQNVIDGYNNAKLAALNNSGISDKTLIEEGQRVLNPGSGVRAQTIKMFGGSSGLLERLDPAYIISHFQKGRLLTDEQKKEYLAILDRAYKDRTADMDRMAKQHNQLAGVARIPKDTAAMYFDNPYADSLPKEEDKAAATAPGSSRANPVMVGSQEDLDKVSSGTWVRDSAGNIGQKP